MSNPVRQGKYQMTPTNRFYRVLNGFTVLGGPVDKRNPQGLLYLDPGSVFDGGLVAPDILAAMVECGDVRYEEEVEWPATP